MYLGMCAMERGAWFMDVARVIRTSETEKYAVIVCTAVSKIILTS